MPAIVAPAKVLVTGASGFVAAWVIKVLLDEGYAVRGTLRSLSKAGHFHRLFKTEVEGGRLEFVEVPDMSVKGAFDKAVQDVEGVLHVASPCTVQADDPNELIEPAVNGTVGILESTRQYGLRIKRVGVTSSCAAIIDDNRTGVLDEDSWNESNIAEVREKGREARPIAKYRTSKTLAEKAAWSFCEKHKGAIEWDLVTFNMPWVFGPVLHEVSSPETLNASMAAFFSRVLANAPQPNEFASEGSWVDVRDVAHGHVRALQVSAAGFKRFILSKEEYIWQDWFDVVNELKIPSVVAPVGTPGSGRGFAYKVRFANERAKDILGLQFQDKVATARDIIEDIRSRGWILSNMS